MVFVAAVFLPLSFPSNAYYDACILDCSELLLPPMLVLPFMKFTCLKVFDFLIIVSGFCRVNSVKIPVPMYISVTLLLNAFLRAYESI